MATFDFNRMALRATQPKLHSMFCALFLKIANYLWGTVKNKFYADKPQAIDALKDNISEAIGEIQLQTIDNVHKN